MCDRVRALGGELTVCGALHVVLRLPLDPDHLDVLAALQPQLTRWDFPRPASCW